MLRRYLAGRLLVICGVLLAAYFLWSLECVLSIACKDA